MSLRTLTLCDDQPTSCLLRSDQQPEAAGMTGRLVRTGSGAHRKLSSGVCGKPSGLRGRQGWRVSGKITLQHSTKLLARPHLMTCGHSGESQSPMTYRRQWLRVYSDLMSLAS